MRLSQRLISLAVLAALSSALAGCGSMSSFDPTDMFDFLDQKKKLAGERKPVFPEGVPGLEQGVPKSLYKDEVEQQQREQAAAAAAAAAPVEEKPKPVARTRTRHQSAARRQAPEPAAGGQDAAETPKPVKQSRRRVTAPPADDQPAAPAAQPQPSATAPAFPAPLPSGSFQR
ncbi:hypothetical protein DNX69_09535 [Rhodopseudomonas palustris]|uniref:Uncharacterized protein n=1 Tax=Rhodopseudomonas palustris TaxID=1076 RepID=A0A323UJH3_RHOPL|nr:hypothetical protein [Rhodopseudomonas palustris]PZA12233.1 hypothetical protein DNX69_09535 [Rhodopseudomonas palustris]